MRAVVLRGTGGPRDLEVQDRPEPLPGPGEMSIDVRAAGINLAELMATQGLYPDAPKPPTVLGYEVCGTVAALGPGANGFAVGDRVMAGTWFGGWAERAIAQAETALPLPDGMSFEEGAAIPVNYGTAYAAIVRYGALQEGERVLVHAAAGGVGIAATQIAALHGGEVWGTASPAKHEAVRANGAHRVLDYNRRGWHRAVPPLDLALDPMGGRSLRRSYKMLRAGGRLVCYGTTDAVAGEARNLVAAAKAVLTMPRYDPLRHLMFDSKTIIGLNLNTLWAAHGSLAPVVEPVRRMLEAGDIRPVVADAVPFSRAGDGLRMLAERRNVGKVVLVPD